jgi:hypothetical protein
MNAIKTLFIFLACPFIPAELRPSTPHEMAKCVEWCIETRGNLRAKVVLEQNIVAPHEVDY